MDVNKKDYFAEADRALDNFINFPPPKPKKRVVLMKWFTSVIGECLAFLRRLVG